MNWEEITKNDSEKLMRFIDWVAGEQVVDISAEKFDRYKIYRWDLLKIAIDGVYNDKRLCGANFLAQFDKKKSGDTDNIIK